MPTYSYTAKTLKGESKKGTLEAKDKYELARALRKEECVLISANIEGEREKRKFKISIPFLNRVSLVEKTMFTRNLRVMVESGISLPRSLKILSEQTKSRKFSKIILEMREEIIKGNNFSDALIKHPNVFSVLFCNMVKVGEETGTLGEVLDNLTQQMEKDHALKSKIKGAMIYPTVIVIAMIGIGTLMMIIVIPLLAKTFDELGVELPITTRITIGAGYFLVDFWYLIPLILFLSPLLLRWIKKTERGKLVIDSLVLKIPIVAPIVRKANSAYTVRTLSSLVSAGVPIVKSLKLVSGSLNNIYYKRAIMDAAEQVKKGSKMSEALEKYKNIYPILVIQMISIGEETGETSNILKKLAEFYEEEVANAAKNLSSVIEPALMIVIGAAVGFFAISMIQPIYSMVGSL